MISSQSGFYLEAPSLERLYISAAFEWVSLAVNLRYVGSSERFTLNISSDSCETLLVDWLNGIVDLFNFNRFLPKQITLTDFIVKKSNGIC